VGLVALAAIGGIVIGLPIVLYRFGGSPVPRQVPGWHRVLAALGSRDDGTLLLATVRDFSWSAWLLFTVSVATEARAAMLGRRAPRLRLGRLQGAAARLVALAAVTFAAPAAVTLAVAAPAMAASGHSPRRDNADPPDTPAAMKVITVRAGDCLWTIAQHYLGAGDRYPEIASLNYGRDMGDGQKFSNPALVEPGWHLLLPTAGPSHQIPTPAVGVIHHVGHATADARYRRRHVAARPPRLPASSGAPASGRSTTGPSPSDEQRRAAGDEIPQTAVFAAGALAGAVVASLGRLRAWQRQYRRRGRRIPLPADPGVLGVERKLRAAAEPEPPRTLREALACLQAGLAASGQAQPDIVGLHLTRSTLEVLLSAPAPQAPPAPYHITPGRQGMCWQLDLPPDAGAASGEACTLLPGLVTAGATEDGYLLLDLEALKVTGCDGPADLVDSVLTASATELATGQWDGLYDLVLVGCDELEALGSTEHCDGLDDALDLLATRSHTVSRRLEGQAPAEVRELRVATPDDEDWALTILVSRVQPDPDQMRRLLELAEDGPGGIAALVAGDPESPDGRMAPTVLQLAPDAADGIVANVVPLQITVRPQALSLPDYEAITTLFSVGGEQRDVSPDDAPYQMYGAPPWICPAGLSGHLAADDGSADASAVDDSAVVDASALDGSALDESGSEEDAYLDGAFTADRLDAPSPRTHSRHRSLLRIGVLGPFIVDGAADQLQPKQAELVLALALAAPAGLSNSALCGMLGADADHPKPADAVRQVITRTRRRLGRAGDGREYIIHTGNGNYVLHEDASLDWTEFRRLVGSGYPGDLRAAVSLIRGQPFDGSYFWWIDIPLVETVRAELVDAAEALAEFEFSAGSARAAAKAARAGLTAESSAEQLWRIVMRAEHAVGNLAGVTEAWHRCLDAIEDIAPGGEPHPETSRLYHRLTTSARTHTPVHS
jgi:DNA-binding SARP family transcriptional activator